MAHDFVAAADVNDKDKYNGRHDAVGDSRIDERFDRVNADEIYDDADNY